MEYLSEENRQEVTGRIKRLSVWGASCCFGGLVVSPLLMFLVNDAMWASPRSSTSLPLLFNLVMCLGFVWTLCGFACLAKAGSLGSRIKPRPKFGRE